MTRTLKFSAIALAAVMMLWACGGSMTSKEVGEKFLMAFAKGDLETAKKFATEDAQTSLDLMQGNSEAKKDNPDAIVIGDVKEEGDKAVMSYTENGKEKTLNLIKENGQWKAAWEKGAGSSGNSTLDGLGDDLGNAMEDAMEDLGEDLEKLGEDMKEAGEKIGEEVEDHTGHDHE